jgi:hypothetical protein
MTYPMEFVRRSWFDDRQEHAGPPFAAMSALCPFVRGSMILRYCPFLLTDRLTCLFKSSFFSALLSR